MIENVDELKRKVKIPLLLLLFVTYILYLINITFIAEFIVEKLNIDEIIFISTRRIKTTIYFMVLVFPVLF